MRMITALKRWYRKRTNSYAYWSGYNEGLAKGIERGRNTQRMVYEVIQELRRADDKQ